MGEEVGTMHFLEFKGEQIKKVQRGANKKSKLRCESLIIECMTEKMTKRNKERRIIMRKRKNEYA
jgi:hypothetical protein